METVVTQHTENSSYREKLIEHLFVAELLKLSWLHHRCAIEVAKPEVDNSGYDLIALSSWAWGMPVALCLLASALVLVGANSAGGMNIVDVAVTAGLAAIVVDVLAVLLAYGQLPADWVPRLFWGLPVVIALFVRLVTPRASIHVF
jgi:hypothetical protein